MATTPNKFQIDQMNQQVKDNGSISDFYKKKFGDNPMGINAASTGGGGSVGTVVEPNKTMMGTGVSTNVPSGGIANTANTAGGFSASNGMLDALKAFKPLNYDPYTDPQYIAAQQMAREGAKSATKSTMETMNNRGLLKSSHTNSGLAQIEQKAELAPLQLVPGLIQNANQQHQQNFQNQLGLAAMAWDQDTYHDTAKRNDFQYADSRAFQNMQHSDNKAFQEAALTGTYMPPGAKELIDEMMKTKTAYSDGMGKEKQGIVMGQSYFDDLKNKGVEIRNKLDAMGIDSSLFGADVGLEQGYKNASKAGIQTVQSQQSMLDMLNNIQQTTGRMPKGAGDIVGGLSAYSQYKDMFTGMEGNPTMAREQFQAGLDQWAEQFGLQKESHALNKAAQAQSMGYQSWLQAQRIDEVAAKQATNKALSDLMNQGGNFENAVTFMMSQQDSWIKNGVDIPTVYDFMQKVWGGEQQYGTIGAVDANGNPIKPPSDKLDPNLANDQELRVKAEKAISGSVLNQMLPPDEYQKLVDNMYKYFKGQQ